MINGKGLLQEIARAEQVNFFMLLVRNDEAVIYPDDIVEVLDNRDPDWYRTYGVIRDGLRVMAVRIFYRQFKEEFNGIQHREMPAGQGDRSKPIQ